MSTQPPTPNIGLVLPAPNSGQPWRTTDYNTLFTTIDTAFGADRTRLSTLEGSVDPAGIGSKGIPAGSTSARDAFWGIPSDDAGALALQQKGARWFNTDTLWTEAYFGKYDTSTNKPGASSRGWYPISGKLPRIRLYMLAAGISGISTLQYGITSAYVNAPANNYTDGMTWDGATGKITVPVLGRYRATSNIYQANGATPASLQVAASKNSTTSPTARPAGAVIAVDKVFAGVEVPRDGNISSFAKLDGETVITSLSDFIQFWFGAGAGTTTIQPNAAAQGGANNQWIDLSYVGPPITPF